jgi:hypothetical protein
LPAVAGAPEIAEEAAHFRRFHVDALLEVDRVAMAKVLVGRAGITGATAKLAAAELIDRPAEGHPGSGQSIHQALSLERLKLNTSSLIDDCADPFDKPGSRPALPP